MDILRFLFVLPLRLARGLFHLLAKIYAAGLRQRLVVTSGMGAGCGRGDPPPPPALRRRRARRRRAGRRPQWAGWHWYVAPPESPSSRSALPSRPRGPPSRTMCRRTARPRSRFTRWKWTFSRSAAPIEQVGKVVTKGITMTPALEGRVELGGRSHAALRARRRLAGGRPRRAGFRHQASLSPRTC
jgi:hypothetical protein